MYIINTMLGMFFRVDELTCGGMVNQVREAFAETMTSVVHLAARYPIACCNSIGLLCIIPYTRAEEKCLVRSGLVHMLDKLCSLTNYRSEGSNTEAQTVKQRVSSMAWAGFQVLSNRCVTWEQEDGECSLYSTSILTYYSYLLSGRNNAEVNFFYQVLLPMNWHTLAWPVKCPHS